MDDNAAWLFDEHVDAVYGYVGRRLGRDAAACVVGDVFEIALSRSERYDPDRGSERAWLLGIATNLITRHWRSEQRRLRATQRAANRPAVPGDALLDIAERIDASVEAERVMAAVGDLPPEDRDLLLLVAWEDTPYKVCARSSAFPSAPCARDSTEYAASCTKPFISPTRHRRHSNERRTRRRPRPAT